MNINRLDYAGAKLQGKNWYESDAIAYLVPLHLCTSLIVARPFFTFVRAHLDADFLLIEKWSGIPQQKDVAGLCGPIAYR